MWNSAENLGYHWQWSRIPRYLFRVEDGSLAAGQLIRGLGFTLKISGVSLVLALFTGFAVAFMRLSGSFTGRIFARGFLEIIRNTPLAVQIYLAYFVIGPVLGLGRFTSVALALALYEGAYMSEIIRAGIVSIEKGQWEAARALGMGTADTQRFVILPQAIRRVLPPLTGQTISLFKDSALASLVSLNDLAMEARIIAADTFLVFEAWFAAAGLYLAVTLTLSMLMFQMEKRFKTAA
ncbi:Polar amino acid ABC transporter permease [Candidatus Desulfarcum epimagneticum]|uniref:Polar amino acid ABC transporter permease n=1 Tax=uncultured Desulfobacteraceae bacterium TaxID=218296 RepID=A0A484HDG9_9BACT|nr:Polar amino acid ABC transporter permease [uncultured Desulfobacteraceae bacterium]